MSHIAASTEVQVSAMSDQAQTAGDPIETARRNGVATEAAAAEASSQPPPAADGISADKSNVDRAHVLADQIGSKVAAFTLTLGFKLARASAVVRETVQDVWAEAQSIRRGTKKD
jgi:hypothetical protein